MNTQHRINQLHKRFRRLNRRLREDKTLSVRQFDRLNELKKDLDMMN